MLPTEPMSPASSSGSVSERLELETVLRALPSVAECRVVAIPGAVRSELIAFIVPAGPFSRSKADERIGEVAPRLPKPDGYALITGLPLTASGALDELALTKLPLIDPDLAAQAEASLLADSRIEHAAVFLDETPLPMPALHVRNLLGEHAGRSHAHKPAAPIAAKGEPAPAPEAVGPRPARPLAVCIGAALSYGSDAARTLPEMLERASVRVPGPCITYLQPDGSTREQSLAELSSEAKRICGGLRKAGLAPRDHVLLQLTRPEDVLPAFWACLFGGFIPVICAIPPSYDSDTNDLERLCHVWRLLDGPPFVATRALRSRMDPLARRLGIGPERLLTLEDLRSASEVADLPAVRSDETAFLSLTSGSTGVPKAIMLSHANILSRARGTNELCRHETSDRILNWLPFDHIGSISDWHLRCIDLGCQMVYCSKEYVLGDPLNWLRLIDRFRITHSWAPNFAYALVNDALNHASEEWELSCMKSLLTAGEAVSSTTVHDFLRRLAPYGLKKTALRPAFGMAELGSGVTYYQPTDADPVRVLYVDRAHLDGPLESASADDPNALGFTSLGPVIPASGMRIVDEKNEPLPEFTVGRLQISGGPVCLGYYKNPEANQDVFVEGGWFNTGDRGFIADRELYLTGRDKESLIINGANYYNGEIEAVVEQVEGVLVSFTAACAVRPAGESEERLAVFFSPTAASGGHLSQLLRQVQNSVAKKTGVKPDFLLPVDREVIPKTGIGKIQRKQLSKRFEAGEFDELVRKVDLVLENDNTLPNWFMSPAFRRKALHYVGALEPQRRYLLLGDGYGLAGELVRALEQAGAHVVLTDRSGLAGAISSLHGGAFSAVLDLTDYGPMAALEPERLSETVAAKARELTRGLVACAGAGSNGASERVRYWMIASHAQAVSSRDHVDALRAVSVPLLKALSQELPSAECRHVDLGFSSEAEELAESAQDLLGELGAAEAEDEVAYRDHQRFVPCFERVTWPGFEEETSALRSEGLYLVTGGLGGVGFELCRYLLSTYGATLLVVGRSAIDASASSDAKASALRELSSLGTVRYRALPVTDGARLRHFVAEAEAEFGRRLGGVFHLAGVYQEAAIAEQSEAALVSVLQPKLEGTLAVHELLGDHPDAFIAGFSSLASVFSGSAIGAYAMANRFLDAISHEQRHHYGRKSYSLNWSVWKGLGIGAEGAPADVLRSKGYYSIAATKGLWSLAAALGRLPGQLLVGIDPGSFNVQRFTDAPVAALGRLHGAFTTLYAEDPDTVAVLDAIADEPGRTHDRFGREVTFDLVRLPAAPLAADGQLDRDAVLSALRGTSHQHVPPETPLQEKLVSLWKDVLGTDVVGIDDSFFDLGGTSLLSVRLFAEIEKQIGVSFSPAILFRAATARALSELIENEYAPDARGSVVPLARGEGPTALFFIHDPNGDVTLYRALAEALDPKIPVYGLRPYQQENYPVLHTRIGDMAAHYVAKIRETQPEGPYLVAGAGPGGVLASEVARLLEQQGQRVALVALLDAIAPGARGRSLRALGLGELRRRVRAARDKLSRPLDEQLKRLGQSSFEYARVRLLRFYTDRQLPPPWFLQHIPLPAVYRFAEAQHRFGRSTVPLTLFRATHAAPDVTVDDTPGRELAHDPELGWGRHTASRLTVIDVPGGHVSMLREPHVAGLAKQLSKVISDSLDG